MTFRSVLSRVPVICVLLASFWLATLSVATAETSAAEIVRAAANAERNTWLALPSEARLPHPDATRFPGAVPDNAPRTTQTITLRGPFIGWRANRPWWEATGTYAPPGALITVCIPPSQVDLGLALRIGAHHDTTDLSRFPFPRTPVDLTCTTPLDQSEVTLANPFGGPIYIEIPNGLQEEVLSFEFAGSIEAPYFRLGESNPDTWLSVRDAPAPWAELRSPCIALTVPSAEVRALEDPAALMAQWERIAGWVRDLGQGTAYAERLVYDPGISAGYMHSGYPIICAGGLDQMLQIERLQQGDLWGFVHELGHNQQYGGWTPKGQGEVTCNWFPVYVLDQLGVRGDVRSADTRDFPSPLPRGTIGSQNPGGDGFFVALRFWRQIKETFGWEPFRQFLATMRDPSYQSPASNEAKWDAMLLLFSQACQRDLTPHFDAWGAEHSDAGRVAVGALQLEPWIAPDAPGQSPAVESVE